MSEVDKISSSCENLSLSELETVSTNVNNKIRTMRDERAKKAFEELKKLESIYDSEILELQDKLYNILKNRKTYIDLGKIADMIKVRRQKDWNEGIHLSPVANGNDISINRYFGGIVNC